MVGLTIAPRVEHHRFEEFPEEILHEGSEGVGESDQYPKGIDASPLMRERLKETHDVGKGKGRAK